MWSDLITFEPGKAMANAQKQWVVGMTLKGRVLEAHPAGDFTQETDDVLVLRAGVYHSWRVPDDGQPWTTVYLIFDPRPSLLPLLDLPEIRPGVMKLSLADSPVRRRVRLALVKASRLLHGRWPNPAELAENALEEAFLWCRAEMERARTRVDPRVQKAVEYLSDHASEPLRLPEIARVASLSVPRFITLFRQYTGTTPIRYIEARRMARARDLLLLGYHTIKEIAELAGYSDPAYFSKRFTRHFRLPPGAYRRVNRDRRSPGAADRP